MRESISIIEPFVIPRLKRRFVDVRDLPKIQSVLVHNIWCEQQRVRLAQLPGNIPSCGDISPRREERAARVIVRYNNELTTRPDLTYAEFENEGKDRELNTDPLRRKAQAFLGCRDMLTNEWIGGVPFSNITIERRTETHIYASMFPTTATPKHPDFTRGQTNAISLQWLLNNDLPLRNGMILDIVQWDFRLPLAVAALVLADPSVKQTLRALGTEFDILGGPDSSEPSTPLRYRRKGLPPAPPDIEPDPVEEATVEATNTQRR